MIRITRVRVASFDLDRLDLWWEIEDTNEDVQDYDFYVLKSGAPLGEFHQIAGPLVDQYHFRDIQESMLHKWRETYYRIKVVDRRTEEESFFPTEGGRRLEAEASLLAMELRRQEFMLAKEFNFRVVWLFKRRRFGARCPNCYNRLSGSTMRSHCETCFGTTYVGGYHKPMEALVQIDPEAESEQFLTTEKTEQTNTTGRALWYPPFTNEDVLVEAENKRWRVVVKGKTELLRAPIHQNLQLHAIIPGDIEYKLPVNLDESTLQASPPREFTNYHNPGEVPDDLRDILDVYGS